MVRLPTIAMTVALVLAQAYVPAQTADGVTFHDLDQMTGRGFGQFSELRAVVTDSSSFAHFVVPARYRQTPHHHDQEQFTLGLAGALDYTIGAVTLRLGGHGVGLPPSNVLHAMINDGDTPATVVEFQPVRRLDWLPAAAPQPAQPRSAEPATVRSSQPIDLDFARSSIGWNTDAKGTRVKVLSGASIRASFWDLSESGAAVNLTTQPSSGERMVFVIDGRLAALVADTRRDVSARTLMVLSASAQRVELRSIGAGGALVVVFETLVQGLLH